MDNFLLNLLKVSAGTTLFYLCYLLFFRKDTFYLRNRIFLILTLLLPTILPLLKIPVQINAVIPSQPVGGMDNFILPDAASAMTIPAIINSFDYTRLMIWLYLSVTGFFLLKILISLISTYRIIRKGTVENNNFPKIIISKDQLPPFSFFPFAVIPEDQYKSGNCADILDHEFAHIRQGHTFDLLLSEIFIAFQWFNPFVWLIRRSVVLNHEYLADFVSLSRNKSVKEYQYRLLNFQSGLKNISLAHSFNSLIKNRIIMINKKPTRKYAMLKNILILPVVLFVVYAFATPKYYYKTTSAIDTSINKPVVFKVKNQFQIQDTSKLIGYSKDVLRRIASEGSYANSLTLVDGKVYTGNINDIPIQTIDNLSVRNYSAAYDKYGVKDKGKVIEITTKKELKVTSQNNNQVIKIEQKEVKGIVVSANGKPIEGVNITSTGTLGNAFMATSGKDGRFSIANVQADAALLFSCRGYKGLSMKPDFRKEMNVKMEKDPEYKSPAEAADKSQSTQRPEPIVEIDGVITEKSYVAVRKDLAYNYGISKWIRGKEATDLYGNKGVNGVIIITTRRKAIEMGLKPEFPRLVPDDYPTFQNMKFSVFSEWVAAHAKYPAEAQEKKIGGWVSVNFKVELDGTLTNIVSTSGNVDPLLVNEILRVIQSSPKWEGPVNKDVDEPFSTGVTLQFKLPDQILNNAPFVVVQEMPMYQPGGDAGLLRFITNNTKYPEEAKSKKIEGRVIIRFIVNTEGKAEGISVLKGVDPLLDAEAVRVVSLLSGFKPGMQGGTPVNVWYMVPVTFKLTMKEADFNKTSLLDILNFLGRTTGYPQEAKNAQDTGKVFVVLKLGKGGIIKECTAVTDKNSISVPLMPEVVIVGYNKPGQNLSNSVKVAGDEHPLLKIECERVARLLTVNEIPDWNDKDLEFALNFRFVLK
jgi:TonB family protein